VHVEPKQGKVACASVIEGSIGDAAWRFLRRSAFSGTSKESLRYS
jgi:hypothetical protein